jgi:hypothetical protein
MVFNLNTLAMIKLTKSKLTEIVSEEVTRINKIKDLIDKKKILQEAIKSFEEKGDIDEVSWQGIKNAFSFGGHKAGQAIDSANKAIDKKVNSVGRTIGKKAAAVGGAVSDFSKGVDKAMTQGDVATYENKIKDLFIKLNKMVHNLNAKQQKLGMKPTTLKSIMFKAANSAKTQMAENKKV